MSLPVISDTFRCAIRATLGTQDVVNVVHVINAVTSAPQDIANDVGHAWVAAGGSLSTRQSSFLHYVDIAVTPLDGGTATAICIPDDFPTDGGISATVSAAQAAAIITWSTGVAGRSFRGRTYLGGIPVTHLNDEGTLYKADILPDLENAANSTLSGLDGMHGSGSSLAVASYVLAAATPVNRATARLYLGTQRRRVD
jgi:hypothetical protein